MFKVRYLWGDDGVLVIPFENYCLSVGNRSDRFVWEAFDDRFDYREERVLSIGMTNKGLLTVVSTQRGERTRIVSAWPATRQETDVYFKNRS